MVFIENALNAFASNLGMPFADIVLVIILFGCLIVFALDLRIGLMFTSATLAVTFILFNLVGMVTENVLIALMLSLVLLSLSLMLRPTNLGAV